MAKKYYVFYGHVTADNYDQPDHHEVLTFDTEGEVLKLHGDWLNPENYGNHDDCSNCVFRVFHGDELKLKAVQKVTQYELQGSTDA